MAAVAAVQGGKLLAIIDDIEGPFIQFEGTVEHMAVDAWHALEAEAAKLEAQAEVAVEKIEAALGVVSAPAPAPAPAPVVDTAGAKPIA